MLGGIAGYLTPRFQSRWAKTEATNRAGREANFANLTDWVDRQEILAGSRFCCLTPVIDQRSCHQPTTICCRGARPSRALNRCTSHFTWWPGFLWMRIVWHRTQIIRVFGGTLDYTAGSWWYSGSMHTVRHIMLDTMLSFGRKWFCQLYYYGDGKYSGASKVVIRQRISRDRRWSPWTHQEKTLLYWMQSEGQKVFSRIVLRRHFRGVRRSNTTWITVHLFCKGFCNWEKDFVLTSDLWNYTLKWQCLQNRWMRGDGCHPHGGRKIWNLSHYPVLNPTKWGKLRVVLQRATKF